jgi:hypothetical protein
VFPNNGNLFTGTLAGFPAVSPITLATLHPLAPGQHVVIQYWVLSAMHCDGFGDSITDNRIPAGENLAITATVQVSAQR